MSHGFFDLNRAPSLIIGYYGINILINTLFFFFFSGKNALMEIRHKFFKSTFCSLIWKLRSLQEIWHLATTQSCY